MSMTMEELLQTYKGIQEHYNEENMDEGIDSQDEGYVWLVCSRMQDEAHHRRKIVSGSAHSKPSATIAIAHV